jgi:VWFA-related protein
MQKWATLVLLAAILEPILTAQQAPTKPVNVDQLNQLLIADRGLRDDKMASQLTGLQLTERANSAALSRWQQQLPGSRSREALVALADASAFLNLPATEIPAIAPPDGAAQKTMLLRAIDYLNKILPLLPNFFATRETTRFEDTPAGMLVRHIEPYRQLGLPVGAIADTERSQFQHMHVLSKSRVAVAYRDGQEVEDAGEPRKNAEHNPAPAADVLATSGEFGPILKVVFKDALKGGIAWSHWEQGDAWPAAVFRYEVPPDKSHFMVTYGAATESQFPAYHGEIRLDAANGNVLRITVITDMVLPYSGVKTGIAVEYGAVVIGTEAYNCPVRSVSLSRMPVAVAGKDPHSSPAPLQTRINDVAFTQYHLLRAESRIVTADNAEPAVNEPAQPAAPAVSLVSAAASSNSAPTAAGESQAAPAPVGQAATNASAAGPAPGPTAPAAPERVQGPKQTAAQAPTAAIAGKGQTTLRVRANLVLLDVVVTKHDKPVPGLEQKNFHIDVDGKEQTIASFDEHRAQATQPRIEQPALPPNTYTNVPVYPEASAETVLLLDGLNTPLIDQMNLRRQMIDYLGQIAPGTKIAIFTMGRQLRLASNFTTDIGEVVRALKGAKSGPQQSGPLAAQSLTRDSNETSNDLLGVGAAAQPAGPNSIANTPTGATNGPMSAAQVIQAFQAETNSFQTDVRVDMTLEQLNDLARALSILPVRKNVIWFSVTFPLVIDPESPLFEARAERSYYKQVEKTTQLLSDARIAITRWTRAAFWFHRCSARQIIRREETARSERRRRRSNTSTWRNTPRWTRLRLTPVARPITTRMH